jgi:hypothetical protein
LFLALIYQAKGESDEVMKILRLMDENAQHYNNYYSAWMAQLEHQSAESLDLYARALGVGSVLPTPSLSGLLKLEKQYKFDKNKLVDAIVESVEHFKKTYQYSVLSISIIDFALAAQLSKNPKLNARKKELFNHGLERFVEKFSSDFPAECERTAVEAWFQKHRSEIQ